MNHRRSLITALGAGAVAAALARSALSQRVAAASPTRETVAILGSGQFGGTIGKRIGALGYPVIFGARTPDNEKVRAAVQQAGPSASAALLKDAANRANIIVIALPWEAAKEVLPTLGPLSGKIVIDPMNWKFQIVDHYPFRPEPSSSISEQVQKLLPDALVVKAFNTIAYNDLANPARAGGPITIPLAGADQNAKDTVTRLITELGLEAVNTGPLVAARFIEDLLLLQVGCAMYNKGPIFELYLRRVAAV